MKSLEAAGRRAAIVLFAALLAMPLLLFHREPGRPSTFENKNTAVFPDLSAYHGLLDSRLPGALDEFFTDNIGLKEQGTLAHISFMYRLFHQLTITNQVEGKERHVFYMTPSILADYQGLNTPSGETLDKTAEGLSALCDAVENYGAAFVFMPIPNKEEIYPEYMPDHIHVVSENRFLHALKNRMLTDGLVPTVDTEQALLDAKLDEDGLLYYRNSDASHWNSNGMLAGYEALMETLHQQDPSISGLRRDELYITAEPVHQPFLYLSGYPIIEKTFSKMDDINYFVSPPAGYSGVSDNTLPVGFSLSGDTQNRYFRYENSSARNQKTILILGDSYIWTFMLPLLSETFHEVYFLSNGTDTSIVRELLNAVAPDVVVYECVSRMVDSDNIQHVCGSLKDAFDTPSVTELPMTENAPIFGFDNSSIEMDRQIRLSDFSDELVLTGWAVDIMAEKAASAVYLRLGDKIFPTQLVFRPDLGEPYLNAGFSVSVPRSALESVAQVEILAVNSAGDGILEPVILPVIAD